MRAPLAKASATATRERGGFQKAPATPPDHQGAGRDQAEEKRRHHRVSAAIVVGGHGDQTLHPALVHPHLARDLGRAHPGAPQALDLFLEADFSMVFQVPHHPSKFLRHVFIPARSLAFLARRV